MMNIYNNINAFKTNFQRLCCLVVSVSWKLISYMRLDWLILKPCFITTNVTKFALWPEPGCHFRYGTCNGKIIPNFFCYSFKVFHSIHHYLYKCWHMIHPNYYWWCGYLIPVDHDGDINIASGMEEMPLTI